GQNAPQAGHEDALAELRHPGAAQESLQKAREAALRAEVIQTLGEVPMSAVRGVCRVHEVCAGDVRVDVRLAVAVMKTLEGSAVPLEVPEESPASCQDVATGVEVGHYDAPKLFAARTRILTSPRTG